jgi:hypothetical protein
LASSQIPDHSPLPIASQTALYFVPSPYHQEMKSKESTGGLSSDILYDADLFQCVENRDEKRGSIAR